ncbi:MAG: hypothetical protein ACO25B_13050, partial [Chitinophagaceae bacterium]
MSAPPSRKIALLCNPLAGSGRAVEVARKLETVLLERNIRPDFLTKEWPASLEDYTDAWIIGGDGTLNFFVNHY